MSTGAIGAIGQQGQQNPTGHDVFEDLDLDAFIKLLVVELSNQDPMEPMDNSQILQQISQIREITSNDRLSETLESVKLGQNMATAAGLIGQTIIALSNNAERVIGQVDRVSIEYGVPKLHVGEYAIDMRNVAGILADGEQAIDETEAEDALVSEEEADSLPPEDEVSDEGS
ncbi:MAG: hypothetical protein A2V70_11925 [Planctomycetes bacterium RBG_13_63_9]|nr:MAG: hypothetical protein A2V70_11925 [Planctomycetes bacterium RBG_13_63_9]